MQDSQNTYVKIDRVSSDNSLAAFEESKARQAPRWFRRSAIGMQTRTYELQVLVILRSAAPSLPGLNVPRGDMSSQFRCVWPPICLPGPPLAHILPATSLVSLQKYPTTLPLPLKPSLLRSEKIPKEHLQPLLKYPQRVCYLLGRSLWSITRPGVLQLARPRRKVESYEYKYVTE